MRELGERSGIATSLTPWGLRSKKDYSAANALNKESLAIRQRWARGGRLPFAGGVAEACCSRHILSAARIWGAAERLRGDRIAAGAK